MRNIKLMPATLGEDTTAPRAFTVFIFLVIEEPAPDQIVHVMATSVEEAQRLARIKVGAAYGYGKAESLRVGEDELMFITCVFAGHHFDIMVAEE